jgi:pSer/pThr/pTyr-binding forkhead associated (FHA) protein
MATVTLQVIDGLEAGRSYDDLETPVTIGREEDCDIRLNDDRVSRLHARIQEDAGRVILTDVDSTNGTRVNGHTVRMRVLQPGDQIVIGRCTLVYGTREESTEGAARQTVQAADGDEDDDPTSYNPPSGHDLPTTRPELVTEMHPLQAAQLSDMLNYLRSQLQFVLDSGQEQKPLLDRAHIKMTVPGQAWRILQKVQMDLAVYLKDAADPPR